MVKLLLFVHIFSGVWFYFNKIENSNTIKQDALKAYKEHYYARAAELYTELLVKYEPNNENIKINLAHACFKAQSYPSAVKYYTELLVASDLSLRSAAQCQLGIIQYRIKHYKLALFYFKEALRTNPENKIAAYNFELLKLKLREEEAAGNKGSGGKNDGAKQKPDQSNSAPENKYNTNGDKEANMFHSSMYEQQNLSKQRAEKILQYLQEQEIQYYHQIQKHVPMDSRKPDW